MTPLLESKNAIIYGGGGSLGSGTARTFAQEGARVFLVGRTAAPLEAAVAAVRAEGGRADHAVLDATDESAVADHVRSVAQEAGSVDVSFNLVSRGDVQGLPFLDIATEDLVRPVTTGLTANFVTARAAARQMAEQGSGVILSLTSGSSQGTAPMMGGTGPADGAIENMMRYLAAEVGPSGVRVINLWTAGVADTLTDEKLAEVGGDGAPKAADVVAMLSSMTTLKRAPVIAQVADTAAFLASDRAAGITATNVNVTCGLVLG
jgi:NAD(P)-dependent dehydrogenase (short-subunit alcohol dehydrogenase family)